MLRFFANHCCFLVAAAIVANKGFRIPKIDDDHGLVTLPLSRKLTKFGGAKSSVTKSSYVGTIRIGAATQEEQQEMLVLFDTGSGQVILDSTRCTAPACLKHHQYSPERSNAPLVNADGQIADPGADSDKAVIALDSNDAEPGRVHGIFVRDHVCLGIERRKGSHMEGCADVILVAATNMTNQPFLDMPFDGIVGLTLEGMSAGPDYNFLGRLTAQERMKAQFALFVPNHAEGGRAEITFGGFRPERFAGPLNWVPVAEPEVGFWQVVVKAVSVGDQEIDICKDSVCRGFMDSSSSQLGVPQDAMAQLEVAMGFKDGASPSQGNGDCLMGPDLHLVLEGGLTLTLTAQEYAEVASIGGCRSLLHPLRNTETAGSRHIGEKETRKGTILSQSFILGEPVLRRYYTVFDWEFKRLGFGLAAASTTAPPNSITEEAEMPEHIEEFILLQTQEQRKTITKHEL